MNRAWGLPGKCWKRKCRGSPKEEAIEEPENVMMNTREPGGLTISGSKT